jgi:hypothetical protein
MNLAFQPALLRWTFAAGFLTFSAGFAHAQVPAPVVETVAPIIVQAVKPRKAPQRPRFEGTVMNATVAQITVRAKGGDMTIQTFSLTPEASAKMLELIDKGGYQYGDKVTVFYDPDSKKALKVKGKPSKAI